MVAIVNGGVHTSCVGTHSCAVGLDEKSFTKGEHVEFYESLDALQDSICQEVCWEFGCVQGKPKSDRFVGIVRIDIDVHCFCVQCNNTVFVQNVKVFHFV